MFYHFHTLSLDVPKLVGIEDVRVTVQCRKLPSIIIGCMYRHPKATVATFDCIQDISRAVIVKSKSLFILGDFNDNLLVIDNKVTKIIKNNDLTQMIDKNQPELFLRSRHFWTLLSPINLTPYTVVMLCCKKSLTMTSLV